MENERMKALHEKTCHEVMKKMERIVAKDGELTSQDLDNLKDGAKVLWYLKECAK